MNRRAFGTLATLLVLFLPEPMPAAEETSTVTPVSETRLDPKTGVELVRIPGGEFEMGSNDGDADEKPAHRVRVSEFWLSRSEVTVAQFRRFADATGYRTDAETGGTCWTVNASGVWAEQDGKSWRDPGYAQGEDHPAVCVSWNDAKAYADWAGMRLPTEAEWEYVVGNGERHSKYSWGDGNPAGRLGGNVADESAKRQWTTMIIFEGYDDGYLYTAPACSFEPNRFGLCDLTGNVLEWCADWYGDKYYAESPRETPPGPVSGWTRVVRGSGYAGRPANARTANRNWGLQVTRFGTQGFRLAAPQGQRQR